MFLGASKPAFGQFIDVRFPVTADDRVNTNVTRSTRLESQWDSTPRHFCCLTRRFQWSDLGTNKNGTLHNRIEVCQTPTDTSRPTVFVPEYACGFALKSRKPPNGIPERVEKYYSNWPWNTHFSSCDCVAAHLRQRTIS